VESFLYDLKTGQAVSKLSAITADSGETPEVITRLYIQGSPN